jgi:hypothetical protein
MTINSRIEVDALKEGIRIRVSIHRTRAQFSLLGVPGQSMRGGHLAQSQSNVNDNGIDDIPNNIRLLEMSWVWGKMF